MKKYLLLAFSLIGISATAQVINASGFVIQDSWDNVLVSTDMGRYHQLIGTYRGWDTNAVYISGYNFINMTFSSTRRLYLGNPNTGRFLGIEFSTGNVGIGTTFPTEKLSVNGNIRSKKLIVTQAGWSDYVFDSSYPLKPLIELEQFIKINKHLPDVPSAREVEKEGIDVGENQALLLKKIEELTLYMIEMKKQNEMLENKVNNQSKRIAQLEVYKKRQKTETGY